MIGGSNPETSKFLFHFYSLISSHLDEFSSFQSKKRAQKLFVQFHFFNVFMYVSIIYDKKQESKVLGYLSRLSFNFWTGWISYIFRRKQQKQRFLAYGAHWSHMSAKIYFRPFPFWLEGLLSFIAVTLAHERWADKINCVRVFEFGG